MLQEIHGYLCVHYALRALIGEVARDLDEDPLRISYTRTLEGRTAITGRAPGFSPKKHAEVFMVFYREIPHELLPPCRQHSNSRVVKRKMSGWPLKRVPKKPK